jgi:integrase
MMFTSADRGVLLKVRRRDLSIFVEGGRYRGSIYLDDTKAAGRSRTVGLGHYVAQAIAELAQNIAPDDRVFDYGYHYVGKKWRSVRTAAGFPDLRMKDMRHIFAGLGLDTEGISLATLKGGMGHARLATTMRYADRDMTFDSDHANKIEAAVFGRTA